MPKIELYNPFDPAGTPLNYLNADKLGDLTGQFPTAYDFAKTFVTPATNSAGGSNGVTTLDDPTYLGFNIRFDIMSPLFNGATIGDVSIPKGDGNGTSAEDQTEISNGVSSHPAGESAVGYLETIGEVTRASYLRAFCQGILEVQRERPYYFQTIEGLIEAYNKTMDMTDPFSGSADGEGIVIGLLEAIDLKMTALFNLYKMACYDVKYRRNILPANLRFFNVDIDVLEIRKFHSVRKAATAGNPNSPENDLTKFVNNNTSRLTFRFSECTFDPTASSAVFKAVTNVSGGGTEFAISSMKWGYGRIEMESQFAGYDSTLKDTGRLQPSGINGKLNLQNKVWDKSQIMDQVEGKLSGLKDNLIKGATNFAQRTINSFTQGLAFGNVFGLRNELIGAISNPQSLIQSLNGAAIQALTGQASQGINQSIDDNIFSGQIPSASGDDLSGAENIFGNGPSGPSGGFTSTNIFDQ